MAGEWRETNDAITQKLLMTRLLAIDPGPYHSAWLLYDTDTQTIVKWAKQPNSHVRSVVWRYEGHRPGLLAIEQVKSYGMPVGDEVFETCVWTGRFLEMWDWNLSQEAEPFLLTRKEIVSYICGTGKAKDGNVRQALIDRWGGKDKAIGLKASPGPLYGLKADGWSALAVAVTCAETRLDEFNSRMKEQHV